MRDVRPRRTRRRDLDCPVVVTLADEVVKLTWHTLNVSTDGVLLEALGRISVRVNIKGTTYHGHLVRAFPTEAETTAYAIALDEAFEAFDASTETD